MAQIKPRYAHFRPIYSGNTLIDQGIMLFFKSPNSYTGEDMVELQVHGGNAVKTKSLEELGQIDTFRAAEPGEFTRRALMNNKLDLV